MKKLMIPSALIALFAVKEASADVRLAEYGQSAYISNRVDYIAANLPTGGTVSVDTGGLSNQIAKAALDIEAVKGLVLGGEAASPYLGGIRVTFNTGANAQVPQGAEYVKALANATLTIQAPNEVYTVEVADIRAGVQKQIFIPCQDFVDVRIRLNLGPADHVYTDGERLLHVTQGQLADAVINTIPPLDPSASDSSALRQFGRAQYYDPDNTYGKRNSGESFPIQRVWDADKDAWVTQFGFYSNNVWHTACDVYNEIPQLDSTGGVVNLDEIGALEHAYETQAYPWNEARRVAVVVDPSMLNANGQATPATNVFFFARVPIYAYKESIETLTVTNLAANGSISSANAYPMQIHWVADPAITNGYDNAYDIPPWEKVYTRTATTNAGDEVAWTTEELGVKEANYYATYKTAPTSAGDGNWRMDGNNNYTLQSYPWPNRDGSQYGVYCPSRGTMNTYAHKLNPYALTIRSVSGTAIGAELASYNAPTNTVMSDRRWAGNTWHEYRAFCELAYIQFGADVQSTASEVAIADGISRVIGIVGNNTTSVLEARQDDLETYFAEQTNLVTFTIAPRAANGYSFAWLGILNFWGSEGDQMADVTVVNETDSDGTQSIWYLANLDRARFMPDTSGAATDYSLFTETYGYERLSYYAAYTGKAGTFYRGKDNKAEYAAFSLVMTTPASSLDLFSVNLNSSPYDAMWLAGYPAKPASGSQYAYYMCSLSDGRYYAIGPWSVRASFGPSFANAYGWGCRASIVFLEAEREARSGED